MKACKVLEHIGFVRKAPTLATLGIGKFRNNIDFNNLPERGIWRIIAGTSDDDFDDCIIRVDYNNGIGMIKAWEESEAARDGYMWSDDWDFRMDGDLYHIGPYYEFDEFLQQNSAINMIEMEAVDINQPPSWKNIQLRDS